MLLEARRQFDFYLVEHPQQFQELEKDPWSYARMTTGQKLASGLRHGDYVQIEKDDARVHHAYADKDGNPRICRPASTRAKRGPPRD